MLIRAKKPWCASAQTAIKGGFKMLHQLFKALNLGHGFVFLSYTVLSIRQVPRLAL